MWRPGVGCKACAQGAKGGGGQGDKMELSREMGERPGECERQEDEKEKHQRKCRQLSTTRNYFQYAFFPRTIPIWNNLPASVAEAPSLVSFKQGLSSLSF